MSNKIKWYRKIPCILGMHDFIIIASFFDENIHRHHLVCRDCKENYFKEQVWVRNYKSSVCYTKKIDDNIRKMFKHVFGYEVK